MMYNSMIPDLDSHCSQSSLGYNSKKSKTLGSNQEISLFDIGLRLDQGLGV